MGTRRATVESAMRGPPSFARSVTIDMFSSKRYFESHAMADVADDPATHAHAASRRRLAKAPAHGRRPASRRRLDPAGDAGDDRALPVAGAGAPVVQGRGHAAAWR